MVQLIKSLEEVADRPRHAVERPVPGKRVTWHTMRRTYASLLQAHNDDPKVVQELLRHASVAITMDIYAQAVSQKKRNAQSKVVEMVVASQRAAKMPHVAAAEASAGGVN